MHVLKRVQIDFADRTVRAIDCIQDIRKAVERVGLNLNLRHDVILQYPMPDENDRVILEIKIPEEKAADFNIGRHLRGISQYLLKTYEEKYRNHQVGNRLLQYTVIEPNRKENVDTVLMMDKYEAVVAFIRLLERSDSRSEEMTKKIMSILKEMDAPSIDNV